MLFGCENSLNPMALLDLKEPVPRHINYPIRVRHVFKILRQHYLLSHLTATSYSRSHTINVMPRHLMTSFDLINPRLIRNKSSPKIPTFQKNPQFLRPVKAVESSSSFSFAVVFHRGRQLVIVHS